MPSSVKPSNSRFSSFPEPSIKTVIACEIGCGNTFFLVKLCLKEVIITIITIITIVIIIITICLMAESKQVGLQNLP